MNTAIKKQLPIKPPPEQPYVQLMLQVFAQARSEQYHNSELLQIVVWLVYRIFDINAKSYTAYFVLSYLFCLLDEWERACDILAHGIRVNDHAALKDMHEQVSAHVNRSAQAEQTSELPRAILPTLSETLQVLKAPSSVIKENFASARSEVNHLAQYILSLENGGKPE